MPALVGALRESVLDGRLALSGLPERWQRVVRAGLPGVWTVEELDAGIARIRAAWAEDEAGHTVQGVRALGRRGISGMLDRRDQITEALTALLEGRSPDRGVRPLVGHPGGLPGCSRATYEMTGMFHADRVQLANVIEHHDGQHRGQRAQQGGGQRVPDLSALVGSDRANGEFRARCRRCKWITLGGVGELPTVAEGAAYTELTWDDARDRQLEQEGRLPGADAGGHG